MNGFLLDTNTVSELVSIKPHQRVLDWMEAADENRLFFSVMTLGKIRQGVAALPLSLTTSPSFPATSATLPSLDSALSTLGRPVGRTPVFASQTFQIYFPLLRD